MELAAIHATAHTVRRERSGWCVGAPPVSWASMSVVTSVAQAAAGCSQLMSVRWAVRLWSSAMATIMAMAVPSTMSGSMSVRVADQ